MEFTQVLKPDVEISPDDNDLIWIIESSINGKPIRTISYNCHLKDALKTHRQELLQTIDYEVDNITREEYNTYILSQVIKNNIDMMTPALLEGYILYDA